jgi:hypothetical protein
MYRLGRALHKQFDSVNGLLQASTLMLRLESEPRPRVEMRRDGIESNRPASRQVHPVASRTAVNSR